MKRLAIWVLIVGTCVGALVAASVPGAVSAPAGHDVRAIASELRCPVCQGLSVADSTSPTAQNMRADIQRRLDDGESRSEIIDAYVARYGEWILLRPRPSGLAMLAWGGPAAIAAAGTVALGTALRRWRRHSPVVSDSVRDAVAVAKAAWLREGIR